MADLWNPAAAQQARERIDALMAPRRLALRRALLRIVLDAGSGSDERQLALARVHDACAKELAERVRLVAGEIKKAYLGSRPVATEILLEDLKLEIGGYLEGELVDLAQDERLIAQVATELPRFLLPPQDHLLN